MSDPGEDFRQQANVKNEGIYEEAMGDREGLWEKQAGEFDWFERWDMVLQWDPPHARWFAGGKINASYNCLDRHRPRGN
ncbi:MAG: acetyl-coenzyme A synthetase N-terminal domain-containing protein [Desulfocucumaceae bacterium]